jgi:D-methionine transport system ATP-binding protein
MQPFVLVQNVSKNFYKKSKQFTALSNICFDVHKGEIFGIMGQSGAGKSTLLRCLATLDIPSSGKIAIGNHEINSLDAHALRRFRKKIGMIFQHFNLLQSKTVFDNIALPMALEGIDKDTIQKKVTDLLHLVGLTHKKDAYPSLLSGGEKQRVGIARALTLDPEILFCDEATSALDPKMTKEILQILSDLNKKLNLTIILITHQMEVIKKICHRAAVLDKGEVVEIASVSTLFSHPEHVVTKYFLQNSIHELPQEMLKQNNKNKLFLRLYFKGDSAKQPIITQLIKGFDVTVNILLGWIDSLQDTVVGTLTVELDGTEENKQKAISFLQNNNVRYEVLTHELR